MYTEIKKCRICRNTDLISIINLGNQYLTGVFPKSRKESITLGPLELVKCQEIKYGNTCGLVQLRHSYNLNEMYGMNYGYRSGINKSMKDHLHGKVKKILNKIPLIPGDMVIDIGSNDGTLLKAYPQNGLILVGIDPTGIKFKECYSNHITLISDFFSASAVRNIFGEKKAKVITSIAMFYDLESPMDFMNNIYQVLSDDGIWVFEQSYMPSMLRLNSYDTICHEHIEYYSLGVVKKILEMAGLKLIDVVMNAINGGSFAVTAAKGSNRNIRPNHAVINWLLEQEERMGLNTLRPYRDFEERVFRHKDDLIRLIRTLNADGKKVFGYGASTKGNVVLQFCGFTEKDIPVIADVNPHKFGCYTPGSHIPIVSEKDARTVKPDYFLVLPWHFKNGILQREKEYLASGGRMIFPFPEIEIV